MLPGLPVELIEEVFSYLILSDLVQAAKINRRIHQVASNSKNRSGRRLANKNRTSIFVRFAEKTMRGSHGLFYSPFAELGYFELNDPNNWRPMMLFITPCCEEHNTSSIAAQYVLDELWLPISDQAFLDLKVEDVPKNNEFSFEGVVQSYCSKRAAISRMKKLIFYLCTDYGVVSSLELTNVTMDIWEMLCDLFDNHDIVRFKPSITLAEVPENLNEFFESKFFSRGIDTIGLFDFDYDKPYYEFCGQHKVQKAQNLKLRQGIGITNVSIGRLKCNTLYAKYPKISSDALMLLIKSFYDNLQGSVRSYVLDIGKAICLRELTRLIPAASLICMEKKKMIFLNKHREKFKVTLNENLCELVIKSVLSNS